MAALKPHRFICDVELHKAGIVLFRQGELGEWAYIIRSGSIELRRDHDDGDQHSVVGVLYGGELFGEMEVLSVRPYAASAVVREDAELLAVSRAALRRLTGRDLAAASDMARAISSQSSLSGRWLEALLYKQPAARVIHSLRLLIEARAAKEETHRGAVYLPLTMRELAEHAAVTPRQAIDVVEQLAESGLLTSASAVDIDGPGYVVAEAELLREADVIK